MLTLVFMTAQAQARGWAVQEGVMCGSVWFVTERTLSIPVKMRVLAFVVLAIVARVAGFLLTTAVDQRRSRARVRGMARHTATELRSQGMRVTASELLHLVAVALEAQTLPNRQEAAALIGVTGIALALGKGVVLEGTQIGRAELRIRPVRIVAA
jgi:hypothetical protein